VAVVVRAVSKRRQASASSGDTWACGSTTTKWSAVEQVLSTTCRLS
jgi:hypothetical protein